ncbi:MAG: hypothetical protein SFW09_06415 [Hyphomicrobiaceae bacterium]|nr:hypothetical protein [Hyphomicrobiaceae bacterium]
MSIRLSLPLSLSVALSFLSVASVPAAAQGLSDLHEKVRVGAKVCFVDHFHSGSSAGHRSKKEAEIAAIRSWQDFTGWEYGSAWGNFRMAESRGIKCDGGGSSWGCNVQARPCRRR